MPGWRNIAHTHTISIWLFLCGNDIPAFFKTDPAGVFFYYNYFPFATMIKKITQTIAYCIFLIKFTEEFKL